jgi:transcriptional regulator with XRE-family HTH domain
MNTVSRIAALRRYVREHPLTQRTLADEIGVSYSWLSKFSRGVLNNPCSNTVAKIEAHSERKKRRRAVIRKRAKPA